MAHEPDAICTGTYVRSEYDAEDLGHLVHDEYTYCPVHDPSTLKKDTPHPMDMSAPIMVEFLCDELSRTDNTIKCDVKQAFKDAAQTIKDLREEVEYHRQMNADQGHLIWWALRKALYGREKGGPDSNKIPDIISGMPQEWEVVQEAIKRLEDSDPPFGLDAYQLGCATTANYPEAGTGSIAAITYCVLGLTGEAGEVADKWKKVIRGDHGEGVLTPEVKALMIKEVGDTTWYAARLSAELGARLSEVAQGNLDKLASRKERGVIKGSGDLR